jgi:membrane-associated progesterone receptor component
MANMDASSSPPILPESTIEEGDASLVSSIYSLLFGSPLNTVLTAVCAYLIYKLFKGNSNSDSSSAEVIKIPPPLPKHNMTLEELRKYDGKADDGRVCVAILGKVYDCTKGRRFYGPEGPYSTFAGRDATRALATFDVNAVKLEWDDHSDLTPSQMSSVQEWEMQFGERYDLVGNLVQEGEENDAADETEGTPEKSEK